MGIMAKYKWDGRRMILFLSFLCFARTFSAQTTYNINDPRNPDCPCHTYQKQAEEEYAKRIRAANISAGELAGKSNFSGDKIHKVRVKQYKKKKRKINGKGFREPRWLYEFRHSGVLKRPGHIVNCPVWNDR